MTCQIAFQIAGAEQGRPGIIRLRSATGVHAVHEISSQRLEEEEEGMSHAGTKVELYNHTLGLS